MLNLSNLKFKIPIRFVPEAPPERLICKINAPPEEVILCKSEKSDVLKTIREICKKEENKDKNVRFVFLDEFQPLKKSNNGSNAGLFVWGNVKSQLDGFYQLRDKAVEEPFFFNGMNVLEAIPKFIGSLIRNSDEITVNSVEDFLNDKRVKQLNLFA